MALAADGHGLSAGRRAAALAAAGTLLAHDLAAILAAWPAQASAGTQPGGFAALAGGLMDRTVEIAGAVNEASIANAGMVGQLREVDGEAQAIAAATEAMGWETVNNVLTPLAATELSELRTCFAASGWSVAELHGGGAIDLCHALEFHRPRILHFVGHADVRHAVTREHTLAMTNDRGRLVTSLPTTLADLLAGSPSLEFCFFNGCSSAALARAVADRGVPAVGWRESVVGMAAAVVAGATKLLLELGVPDRLLVVAQCGQQVVLLVRVGADVPQRGKRHPLEDEERVEHEVEGVGGDGHLERWRLGLGLGLGLGLEHARAPMQRQAERIHAWLG